MSLSRVIVPAAADPKRIILSALVTPSGRWTIYRVRLSSTPIPNSLSRETGPGMPGPYSFSSTMVAPAPLPAAGPGKTWPRAGGWRATRQSPF